MYYAGMKLMIIWGSSRQGRKGGVVADWVKKTASADQRLEIDFVDLKEVGLPFYDEPSSPYTMAAEGQDYVHPEGRTWADRVAKSEAVILITPEYNHAPTAVLKNALDWVGPEWKDKPVGLISYGGASGGARAVEQLRSITIELGLVQVANAIHLVRYKEAFDDQGEPKYPGTTDALKRMFDEIMRLQQLFSKA